MTFSAKAYINATGKMQSYTLMHDIKRCLADAKAGVGLINILSSQATTAVALLENDEPIRRQWAEYISQHYADIPSPPVLRRSGTGPDKYHLMAAMVGLSLTLPFAGGRLATHPQHEVYAVDFEPKAGRREFVITVLSDPPPAQQQGGR